MSEEEASLEPGFNRERTGSRERPISVRRLERLSETEAGSEIQRSRLEAAVIGKRGTGNGWRGSVWEEIGGEDSES